jgi:hypothetical protein
MCCFDLLTIEILGSKEGIPVVLDRVFGGSLHLDEANRVGQHLLPSSTRKQEPATITGWIRNSQAKNSSLKTLRDLDTAVTL